MLERLAQVLGIQAVYTDAAGQARTAPETTVRAICLALGYAADTASQVEQSLARAEQLDLPAYPTGPCCRSPSELLGDQRATGLCVNLYSVRSERNHGVGDLGDLRRLVVRAADWGMDFVLLNPLFAGENEGDRVGPYGPITRHFRNELYLALDDIPEWSTARPGEDTTWSGLVASVRNDDHIDYELVAAAKLAALEGLFQKFHASHGEQRTERGAAYRQYVRRAGPRLADYAVHRARSGGSADLHRWVQFELERQLAEVQQAALDAGMAIGLVHDLPVGVSPVGPDVVNEESIFVPGMHLGVPPDALGPSGQDWELPPLNPMVLQERGMLPWRRLVQRALAHGGGLRIDHVLGLARQFWIPEGAPASEGAYVTFPRDAMFAVLAEESQASGSLVIGEDLGTVPEGLSEAQARAGVLATRVFLLEGGNTWPATEDFDDALLLTATTHDTPTLRAWWTGRDLELREELDLVDAADEARDARTSQRSALKATLVAAGRLNADETDFEALRDATHEHLLASPARLVGIALDDLVGETEPVNIPGVAQEQFSNWTRRQSVDLAQILNWDLDLRRA